MSDMEVSPEQHGSSVCDAVTIKQEPVEAKPYTSLKQEIEYIYVKEETPEFEEPDGHSSAQDPLQIVKKELEEPDGHNSAQDPLNIAKEEYSSSEEFLGPSICNIDKTENIEDDEEEGVSEDDWEELKHEVQATSSEQESINFIEVEDDKCSGDHGSFVSKVPGTDNRTQSATKKGPSCGNKTGTKRVAQLEDLKDYNHVGRRGILHSCEVCHKTFAAKGNLKIHMRVHTSEQSYSCSICNKTFTKTALKRHSRIHTGERPYSCSICNKTFTQSNALRKHSRVHTGERPHSCSICNKTFTQSGNLKKHLLVHTGDRPYSCSICNMTFTQSNALKRHSLVHTGERPYSCSICNKTYTKSFDLKKHLLLHSGERQYSCSICNKTFVHIAALKKHSLLHTC